MKKETVRKLVDTLYNDLTTLSADNPSFYANIYADKYNNLLNELKSFYQGEGFIQNLKELAPAGEDSMELTRLFRNVIISVNQLKAFVDEESR